MGAQSSRKCKHIDTENTLCIYEEKRLAGMIMLKKAILTEVCKDCDSETDYFILGGILHSDKSFL